MEKGTVREKGDGKKRPKKSEDEMNAENHMVQISNHHTLAITTSTKGQS